MRFKNLLKVPGISVFGDERTHAHLCCNKSFERPSGILQGLLSRGRNPLFGCRRFHLFRHVKTKALRVAENLDSLIGDDLRLCERSSYNDAGSPAGMNTDSKRVHDRCYDAPKNGEGER